MAYTLNPSEALPYGMPSQFAPNNSGGVPNYLTGSIVMDATTPVAAVVPLGFTPRKLRLIDITALSEVELVDMFPAGTALKTAYAAGAPTKTIDTTGLLTVQDRQFTASAAALTASHTYVFEAWA